MPSSRERGPNGDDFGTADTRGRSAGAVPVPVDVAIGMIVTVLRSRQSMYRTRLDLYADQ